MPIIKMLSTGDEVLHGQILDSNAAWLADYFFEQGAPLIGRATVGDNLTELVAAIQRYSQSCDILIINGGLGPTSDDLTCEAVATATSAPLSYSTEWATEIERYFSLQQRIAPPSNFKQALLPQGAHLFANPIGTACGFMVQYHSCQIYCTPGVPAEFKQMVENVIFPFIQQHYKLQDSLNCLRLTVLGCSESELADRFADLSLPADIVLGFRADYPTIEIKLTAPCRQQLLQQQYWEIIRQQVAQHIIYTAEQGIFGDGLYQSQAKQLELRLYECFTAGLLTQQLASQQIAFQQGIILPEQPNTTLQDWQYQLQQIPLSAGQLLLSVSGLFNQQLYFALRHAQQTHYWRFNYRYPIKQPHKVQKTAVFLAQHLLKQYVIYHVDRDIVSMRSVTPNIPPFTTEINKS